VADAPEYSHGFTGLLACIVVAICAISAYGVLCRAENAKRDRAAASHDSSKDDEEPFSDLTDKEKKTFRYCY